MINPSANTFPDDQKISNKRDNNKRTKITKFTKIKAKNKSLWKIKLNFHKEDLARREREWEKEVGPSLNLYNTQAKWHKGTKNIKASLIVSIETKVNFFDKITK